MSTLWVVSVPLINNSSGLIWEAVCQSRCCCRQAHSRHSDFLSFQMCWKRTRSCALASAPYQNRKASVNTMFYRWRRTCCSCQVAAKDAVCLSNRGVLISDNPLLVVVSCQSPDDHRRSMGCQDPSIHVSQEGSCKHNRDESLCCHFSHILAVFKNENLVFLI